jgi:hypothetical protein
MLTELKRRHNGQLQACEPCRKAKVRCDHATPECSRCARRSLSCVYHPAPMTKRCKNSHTATSTDATPPAGLVTTPAGTNEFHLPTKGYGNVNVCAPSVDPGSVASSSMTTRSSTSKRNVPFREELGEHETTRFSAVFLENLDSLGPGVLEKKKANHVLNREHGVTASPRLELAVRTLLNFPTARTCNMLMEGIDQIYDFLVITHYDPTVLKSSLDRIR